MTTLGTAYALLRAQLAQQLATATWPSPEAGFVDYLQRTNGNNTTKRALVTERLSETPMLAAAGYQYANPRFPRPAGYDEDWARHFKRLAQRQAFPIDRESYFYRPLDLLGICVGAQACPALTDQDREWLKQVMRDGATKLPEHSRAHYLGSIAAHHVGIAWTVHTTPRVTDLPLASLCLLHWMTNNDGLAPGIGLDLKPQELATSIINETFTGTSHYDDLADAGLILYATSAVIEQTITARVEESFPTPRNTKAALSLVRTICDRFTIVANTLTVRHDNRATITMKDEYDVQDLLGALLKLHFTDVRPEEWTPSYAGNASRMDFLLKPERLVIEAKMTRKGLGQKELTNQIAIDILRYQAHQDCKTLVCFIYDPTGECKNPTALENDLTKDHGGLNVTVIVQPQQH